MVSTTTSTTPDRRRRRTNRNMVTPKELRRDGGGRRPWSTATGAVGRSALGGDVPEVRVGVVGLLDDIGLLVGGEVAGDAVPRREPGLLDDVLVQLLGGGVSVGVRAGLDRLDQRVDLRVAVVERV